jgi:WD40 repeat protein
VRVELGDAFEARRAVEEKLADEARRAREVSEALSAEVARRKAAESQAREAQAQRRSIDAAMTSESPAAMAGTPGTSHPVQGRRRGTAPVIADAVSEGSRQFEASAPALVRPRSRAARTGRELRVWRPWYRFYLPSRSVTIALCVCAAAALVLLLTRARLASYLLGRRLASVVDVCTLGGHGAAVRAIAFSEDGKWLVSLSDDYTIRKWDVATATCVETIEEVWDGEVPRGGERPAREVLRLSVAGDLLGVGSSWAPVSVLSLATGERMRSLESAREPFAFSPVAEPGKSATLLASSQQGCTPGPLAFSPDGRLLATGSADMDFSLWEIRRGDKRHELHGVAPTMKRTADGWLEAGIKDWSAIRIWNALTGECLGVLSAGDQPAALLDFSDNGRELASISAGNDLMIRVWDVTSQRCKRATELGPKWSFPVNRAALGPRWRILAAPVGKIIQLLDLRTGRHLRALDHGAEVTCVAFKPDGSLLASAADDGTVKLWAMKPSEVP